MPSKDRNAANIQKPLSFDRRIWCIGGEEGVEAGGRVIGDLAQSDAAGAEAAVFDLDGADDQHFALMGAPAAARDRTAAV
jgi:hypothetical protein